MKEVLERNNYDFLYEINFVNQLIREKKLPSELERTRIWLLEKLEEYNFEIKRNLTLLSLNDNELLNDILTRTQNFLYDFRNIYSFYVSPLFRYQSSDIISVKLINWLHNQHETTRNKEFLISDGNFSITQIEPNPVQFPIIYYLPNSSQKRLLHMPLFFHEIGHYFFSIHKPEMKDIIIEFQKKLENFLLISFQQNDLIYEREKENHKIIIETWNDWLQEFFCDFVGLQIGGPSYLYAFSSYLRMDGINSFFLPEIKLQRSSHPISWIRIKLLSKQATKLGMNEIANQVNFEWNKIAELMNVREKFYGFYADEYEEDILDALNTMLIEASPIYFKSSDLKIDKFNQFNHNYIQLLNLAWKTYLYEPKNYNDWEKEILKRISE